MTMLSKLRKLDLFTLLTSLLSIVSISNVLIYYAFGTSKASSFTILLVVLGLLLYAITSKKVASFVQHMRLIDLCVIALDLVLIYIVYQSRTLDVTPSPWMKLGPLFFVLYAGASALLLHNVSRAKNTIIAHAQTALHVFVTYSIAAIFYPLGFGFDGFIHRATETWIAQNGFILPKQPFYIGQYGLVVWLHNITTLPIFYLDVFLVPLLASLSLPAAVSRALKKVWNISYQKALIYFWIIPIIFYLSLHLTTPHNLVILLLFLGVFTTLPYLYDADTFLAPLLIAIWALLTHPLIGAPLFLFTICAYLIKKNRFPKAILITYTFLLATVVPLMFTTHLLLSGQPLPDLLNPFEKIGHFLHLFSRPYWYAQSSPLHIELLYAWQWIIAPLVTLIGLLGFYTYSKKKRVDYLLLLSFFAFIIGAYLLRSWVVFPDVIELEQGDYPLRLLKTSVIFLLPYIMLLFHKMDVKIQKKSFRHVIGIGVAGLLMISLYLAYPQRNQKVWFPGFNVTLSDVKAAQWIHDDNIDDNYVVLANPMVSMAALEKYSFKKSYMTSEGELFYYAIPTGGPLYKIYQKMLYEGQNREYMQEALDLTGANKAYFVINSYWSNFEDITQEAQKNADARHDIDDGKIVIFTYE